MLRQGNQGFPDRVQRAIAAADKLAAERRVMPPGSGTVASSSEYQELVRLKVMLEVETSRALVDAARISAELERSNLAERLLSASTDQ